MFAASGASVDIYYNNFGPLVRQIANVTSQMQAREAEVAGAGRVLAAFAADPAAGVVTIDGRMIDKPHERAARRILEARR